MKLIKALFFISGTCFFIVSTWILLFVQSSKKHLPKPTAVTQRTLNHHPIRNTDSNLSEDTTYPYFIGLGGISEISGHGHVFYLERSGNYGGYGSWSHGYNLRRYSY